MSTFTRAMKFAVFFKDLDRKALEGKTGLWYELARVQGEITRAANQAVSALYLVKSGAMPHPAKEDGAPIHLRSLAYALFRQRDPWHPFGEERPVYRPEGRRLSGANLTELSGTVFSRLETDYKDIRAGRKAISTFRALPIPLRADSVALEADGSDFSIRLSLWEGRSEKVAVAPILTHRDHGQRDILRKLVTGAAKHGAAKLYKDERSGKWMMSLSWTAEVTEKTGGTLVAGINLGIITTASIAYIDAETGALSRDQDRISIAQSTVTAWKRVDASRVERLRYGRLDFGVEGRAGRGVTRKIRAVEVLSSKRERLVSTAVRQAASAVVNAVLKRGAKLIVLEDLSWSVEAKMKETAGLSNADRAQARKNFLIWQQGALRAQIKAVAEREGLAVVEVSARHDSNTCAACGTVYPRPPKVPGQLRQPYCDGVGRITWARFKCACGHGDHADHNAAAIVAKRGREVVQAKAAKK